MRPYKVSELIIDMSVYPRQAVDGDHVFNIMEAMRTGMKFPPVVVCKLTKRIVDGAHRVTATQRLFDHDADIECIEKTYANDQEFFLDAIKYNAGNGRNLTRDDRARIAVIGEQLKIDDSRLADSLSTSEHILGGLRAAELSGGLSCGNRPGLASRTRGAASGGSYANAPSVGASDAPLKGGAPAHSHTKGVSHEALAESTRATRMLQGCIAVLDEIDWAHCEDDRLWDLLLELRETVLEKLPAEPV